MKRFIGFSLVLLVTVCCLASCNFWTNTSGGSANNTEANQKAEEMITALAENRLSDAKALMHPQKADNIDASLAQMSEFLDGRKANTIEATHVSVHSSAGTAGKTRQETVSYKVTLSDSDVIYISVVYLSNNDGAGFISFQLVLGIV